MSDWKMVPVDATPGMVAAGKQTRQEGWSEIAIYDSMLAAAPSPWQDIETAPKSSKHILLFGDGEAMRRCAIVGCWWNDKWSPITGRMSWFEPTHWMPLPDEPEGYK